MNNFQNTVNKRAQFLAKRILAGASDLAEFTNLLQSFITLSISFFSIALQF